MHSRSLSVLRGLAALAALLSLMGFAAATASADTFRNPVRPLLDDDSPDPQLQTWNGHYYLMSTHSRAIKITKSATLGGLASAKATTIYDPAAGVGPAWKAEYMWAPEVHRIVGPNGPRWYVYVAAQSTDNGWSASTQMKMHVLESAGDDPLGPYSYKGEMNTNGWAIDATVFEHSDGRLYTIFSCLSPVSGQEHQRLCIQRLANPWTTEGARLEISAPTLGFERIDTPTNEGPAVLVRDGKLNVVYSASQCTGDGYRLGRLTVSKTADLLSAATWQNAKSPNSLFFSSDANRVYGPGHNSFFTSPDGTETWMAYHAHSQPWGIWGGGGCFGVRTTRVQKVAFNSDGTPNLGVPQAVGSDLALPSGDGTIAREAEAARIASTSGNWQWTSERRNEAVGERIHEYLSDRPGNFVTYGVRLPAAGRYRVYARVEGNTDTARVQLAVRGSAGFVTVGTAMDTYRTSRAYHEFAVGEADLVAGENELRLLVDGKTTASANYRIRVDQFRFEPVG